MTFMEDFHNKNARMPLSGTLHPVISPWSGQYVQGSSRFRAVTENIKTKVSQFGTDIKRSQRARILCFPPKLNTHSARHSTLQWILFYVDVQTHGFARRLRFSKTAQNRGETSQTPTPSESTKLGFLCPGQNKNKTMGEVKV